MGVRQANLGPLKAGITRLRDKGGASPESLFDLLNGYVDASGAPTSRDGTSVDHTLPAGTKGLCAFQGKKHVFALQAIDPGSAEYVVDILIHPDPAFAGTLTAIHFAKPFLGFLYVVAEFSDGNVFHYWLQAKAAWQPDTVYLNGQAVRPSTPNGFIYSPTTSDNPSAWQPSTAYALGDAVQPTTYNGFKYVLVELDGDSPTSGATEPVWLTSEGALVTEDVDNTPAPSSPSNGSGGSPAGSRYDNLPGIIKGALQP
jgi:hypothetical protein